jgi:Type IV secretion-system coupling protein DNA-binding domain
VQYCGFQNISQLRSIYGRDGAITLTSSPTTKALLRADEGETTKWASELLGSRELECTELTMLAGLSNHRAGVNLQSRHASELIVTPAQIQLLKPLHGFLAVAGENRTTLTISRAASPETLSGFHPEIRAISSPTLKPRPRSSANDTGKRVRPESAASGASRLDSATARPMIKPMTNGASG